MITSPGGVGFWQSRATKELCGVTFPETPILIKAQLGRRASVMAVASLLVSASLVGCATQQQDVSQQENQLSAAGFDVRPANTPERQAMLKRLPPDKFVQRTHGNAVTYVYADPLVCDCLYVGDQQAYGRYQQYVESKQIADERQLTAQLYSDPGWDWGGWGPWGGGYGFGPGPGF